MNLTRQIKDKILLKSNKEDKNGRDFLILELEQGETMFVFHNQDTPETSWTDLEEEQEYLFTIKEGNRIGSNILVGFERIIKPTITS
jgi:hypothetical protein